MSRTLRPRSTLSALTLVLLTACGQHAATPGRSGSGVQPQSADATSSTSLLLRLNAPADQAALNPSSYHLTSSGGASVAVRGVYPMSGNQQLLLATDEQAAGTYTLALDGAATPVTFTASSASAPTLRSATALNHTQVLLRFVTKDGAPARLNDLAGQAAYFQTTDLAVTGAQLSADRTAVVLTTAPQANMLYRVQAAGAFTPDFALIKSSGVTFTGVPSPDTTAPQLQGAESPDRQGVLLHFSEPLGAVSSSNFQVLDEHNLPITVRGATFTDEFHTDVRLETDAQQGGTYRVLVTGVQDASGNTIDAAERSASFAGAGTQDDTPPTVRSAQSTSSTTLVVTFSEPVRGGTGEDGAENPANYTVTGAASSAAVRAQSLASALKVTGAKLSADQRSVTLTTLAQADVDYGLLAANIRDLVGNAIDSTTGIQNQRLVFRGTPPSGNGPDTDGDGLSDSVEQAGWTVSVKTADGRTQQRDVTSDPTLADTDGDGLTDLDERSLSTDPRASDTDGDTLDDNFEYNTVFSAPTVQDTDGDGLADNLEVKLYHTSAILADTDGDQFSDGEEVTLDKYNPRVADLPLPKLSVDGMDMALQATYSYTDSQGQRQTDSKSTTASLTQSSNRSLSNSDTNTVAAHLNTNIGLTVGGEVGFPVDEATFEASMSVDAGYSSEHVSSVTRESAESASRQLDNTETQELEKSRDYTVQRNVTGGTFTGIVKVGSEGSVPFTLSNLEITVLQQDPADRSRLRPVATLRRDGDINLGPLSRERGPFNLKDESAQPDLIEDLMRNPRGLLFKFANYDIKDEAGRNFVFAGKEVNDRTAEIIIDYGTSKLDPTTGQSVVQRYRVATSSVFDQDGRPVGITLDEALRGILGLAYTAQGDRLTELGGVSNHEAKREGWIVTATPGVKLHAGLAGAVLKGGDTISLAYVRDTDGDGLSEREEYLYNSSDQQADTDGDGVGDYVEARTGWQVNVAGEAARLVHSAPSRTDSDLDGLSDKQEQALGTDPNLKDSDDDGVTDADEVNGYAVTVHYPGQAATTKTVKTDPLSRDSDGDAFPDGAERRAQTDPVTRDTQYILDEDNDGLVSAQEDNGWTVSYTNGAGATVSYTATPSRSSGDTDSDGLPDLLEYALKTDPTKADTDADGLTDLQEFNAATFAKDNRRPEEFNTWTAFLNRCQTLPGCTYTAPATPGVTRVLAADTDADGLGDGFESGEWDRSVKLYGEAAYYPSSSPTVADTDKDGVKDGDEYNHAGGATDPSKADSDGDTVGDGREPTLGTNPLRKDKKVHFQFTTISVPGDCDDHSDLGQKPFAGFTGTLQLVENQQTHDLQDLNSLIGGIAEGESRDSNAAYDFVLGSGEGFKIQSTNIEEEDNTSTNEKLGALAEDRTFDFQTGPGSRELKQSDTCRIVINWTIDWLQ